MSLTLRTQIGRRLTIAEIDGNFIYLEGLTSGNNNNVAFVNSSMYGATLSTTASVFFCDSGYSYTSVNLPDVSEMQGRELKFISVDNNYEGSFNINGPFYDSSTSYNLNGYGHTVTLISDGTYWWILNQYTP